MSVAQSNPTTAPEAARAKGRGSLLASRLLWAGACPTNTRSMVPPPAGSRFALAVSAWSTGSPKGGWG